MDYVFSVGLEISTSDAYSGLDSDQKQEARNQLFESVSSVRPHMGEFATDEPLQKLKSLLESASTLGETWRAGEAEQRGVRYVIDPLTGELVCVYGAALTLNSVNFAAAVEVDGVQIGARFFVQFAADNGPVP